MPPPREILSLLIVRGPRGLIRVFENGNRREYLYFAYQADFVRYLDGLGLFDHNDDKPKPGVKQ